MLQLGIICLHAAACGKAENLLILHKRMSKLKLRHIASYISFLDYRTVPRLEMNPKQAEAQSSEPGKPRPLTCGFEEAASNDPKSFEHLIKFRSLSGVKKAVSKLEPTDNVTTFHKYVISKEDFDSLEPGSSVSISLMQFVYSYLKVMARNTSPRRRIALMKPSRVNQLITGKVTDIEAMTFDLQKRSFVFMPIQCPDGHWSLLLISPHHLRCFYYNPNKATCSKGQALAGRVLERLSLAYGTTLSLTSLGTPQEEKNCDSGILVCEITALLIRKLTVAVPGDRLSLGLGKYRFVVGAGRTVICTIILELRYRDTAPPLPSTDGLWELSIQHPTSRYDQALSPHMRENDDEHIEFIPACKEGEDVGSGSSKNGSSSDSISEQAAVRVWKQSLTAEQAAVQVWRESLRDIPPAIQDDLAVTARTRHSHVGTFKKLLGLAQ